MANIKYNPDHDLIEVLIGDLKWTEEVSDADDEPYLLLDDEEQPHLVVFEGSEYLGLKENTVYKLIEVPTVIDAEEEIILPEDEPAEGTDD